MLLLLTMCSGVPFFHPWWWSCQVSTRRLAAFPTLCAAKHVRQRSACLITSSIHSVVVSSVSNSESSDGWLRWPARVLHVVLRSRQNGRRAAHRPRGSRTARRRAPRSRSVCFDAPTHHVARTRVVRVCCPRSRETASAFRDANFAAGSLEG